MESKSWPEKLGVFQCMKRIHNKVLDETGINLMNEVIENYLRTGELDIAEPYASLMKEEAVSYVQGIFQKLKDYEYKEEIQKTRPDLYGAFGCNRNNFANSLLITRKMHDKKYSCYKQKDILAYKMSISFHPEDNDKLNYKEADKMAREFAHKFFWSKGYEVMWAVHTDTEHIHVHFIVSNCNLKDGKSFRREMPELKEMSQFFREQCRERGLTHSVRGSRLGSRFTVAGIRQYMQQKQVEYRRIMQDRKSYGRLKSRNVWLDNV